MIVHALDHAIVVVELEAPMPIHLGFLPLAPTGRSG
jgi:hypothetical protein